MLSALGSDISEKQSIVYTFSCIEEARIVRTLSHTDSNDGSHSHTWNDEYQALGYQLDQWGVDKLLVSVRDRDLLILASSIQSDVYTILCFSDMSLPRADLFPDFIFLTSPHERSEILFQEYLKLPSKLKNQELWWMVISISDAINECYHQ